MFENTVEVQGIGKRQAVRQQVQLEVGLRSGSDIFVGLEGYRRQGPIQFRQHPVGAGRSALSVGLERVGGEVRFVGPGPVLVADAFRRFGNGAFRSLKRQRVPGVEYVVAGIPGACAKSETEKVAHVWLALASRREPLV